MIVLCLNDSFYTHTHNTWTFYSIYVPRLKFDSVQVIFRAQFYIYGFKFSRIMFVYLMYK